MFTCYLNNSEATVNAFDEEGWFKTGDLAEYTEDGFFKVVDRIKSVIKVRGIQVKMTSDFLMLCLFISIYFFSIHAFQITGVTDLKRQIGSVRITNVTGLKRQIGSVRITGFTGLKRQIGSVRIAGFTGLKRQIGSVRITSFTGPQRQIRSVRTTGFTGFMRQLGVSKTGLVYFAFQFSLALFIVYIFLHVLRERISTFTIFLLSVYKLISKHY